MTTFSETDLLAPPDHEISNDAVHVSEESLMAQYKAAYQQQNRNAAVKALQEIVDVFPGNASALLTLIDTLIIANAPSEADLGTARALIEIGETRFPGMPELVKRKEKLSGLQQKSRVITSDSMFRLATNLDLIQLKIRYQDYWLSDIDIQILKEKDAHFKYFVNDMTWGLKQMGHLFVVDAITRYAPKTMLEAGGGFNLYFDRHFSHQVEYWMTDQSGFYNQNLFTKAMETRHNTRFVNGLLGDFNADLKDNYFDLVFSISVLEHVKAGQIKPICDDMFRMLKPGGVCVHTIDLTPFGTGTHGMAFYKYLIEAGFKLDVLPDLDWNFNKPAKKQILLETLAAMYTNYAGRRDTMWEKPNPLTPHTGTILVLCRKPEA